MTKITPQLEQTVCDLFLARNKTQKEIAEICQLSTSSIQRIIKKYHLLDPYVKRQYEINENYLDQIDSEEKAYFLGWMWSDGSMRLGRKSNKYGFTIAIQGSDKVILEKLSALFYTKNKVRYYQNKNYKCGEKVELSFNNKKLYTRLMELGCHPQKTLDLQFPKIDLKYYWHFIRGYFDGDGYLRLTKTNYARISICCTLDLANAFKAIFPGESYIYSHGKIYNFVISSLKNVNLFLKLLYCDATLYLDRKYLKYLEFNKKYQQYLSGANYLGAN